MGEELTASNVLEKSPCAMVIALDAEDGKSVNMYIFKDGLEEEKAVRSILCVVLHCLYFSTVKDSPD